MILNQSFYRVATIAAAAFLLSFAYVRPAGAQTSTRHVATCTAVAQPANSAASCTMAVPAGKVFIIESATAYGGMQSGLRVKVTLITKFMNVNQVHAVVAGFPMGEETTTTWTGAIPGTIFSEGGFSGTLIEFGFYRWGAFTATSTFRVTLSGRLEDM